MLEVRLRASRLVVVDELLSGAPSERADQAAAQVFGAVAVAVGIGALEGHTERPAARMIEILRTGSEPVTSMPSRA